MHAVVFSSTDKTKQNEYIALLQKEYNVDPFDVVIIEETIEKPSIKTKQPGAIGIKTIRQLQQLVILPPYKGTKRLYVVPISTITTDAQHALLKTLEEPPLHAIIVLLVADTNILLETVLSRCTIYRDTSTVISPTTTTIGIRDIAGKPAGEKLAFAQSISSTKEDALTWLVDQINQLRDALLDTPTTHTHIAILKKLQTSHTVISTTNANIRVVVEELLLEVS